MKKLISIIICLSISLISTVTVNAEDKNISSSRKKENTDIFFKSFPVITDIVTEDKSITRAEFADIIYNIVKRSGAVEASGNTDIDDVYPDTPYIGEINAITSLGFMCREVNNKGAVHFRPDDIITDTEAIAEMVTLLGCDYIISGSSDYEVGVWRAANEVDIDVTHYSGKDNAEWIKNMVFEALNGYTAKEAGMQNGYLIKEVDTSRTYINKYWDLEETEGILSANSMINIKGRAAAVDNSVVIGDNTYFSYLIYENTSLLGQYVHAYYSTAKENEDTVLCMYPSKNYSQSRKISSRDLDEVTSLSKITSYEGNHRITSNISEQADIYFNYEYMGPLRAIDYNSGDVKNMLDLINTNQSCQIVLVENTGDGNYDFVWIQYFSNYAVSKYSYTNNKIEDKYGKVLDIERAFKYNNIMLLDENGEQANVTGIGENDVLSVFTSEKDGKIEKMQGFLSKASVSGTLSQVNGEDCTINGDTYYISPEYAKLMSENDRNVLTLKPGLMTTFYVNTFNEIVSVSMVDYYRKGVSYAFIIGAYRDSSDTNTLLRVLNEDGEIVSETLDKRVKINGTLFKSESAMNEMKKITGEPVQDGMCYVYRMARITKTTELVGAIELSYNEVRPTGASLDRMYPDTRLYSGGTNTDGTAVTLADGVYKSNTFGKRVGITTSAIVFDIPLKNKGEKPVKDENAYILTSVSNMQDDCMLGIGGVKKVDGADGAYMDFFDIDSTLFASAAVRYYKYDDSKGGIVNPPEMQSDCVIVTDVIKEAVNDDMEKVIIIKGYKGGAEVILETTAIKNQNSPWAQFTTLTDSANGAMLEKADGSVISPSDVNTTGLLPGDVIQVSSNSNDKVSNMLINVRAGDADNAAWLMLNGTGTGTTILSGGAGHGNEYLGVNYGKVEAYQNGKVVMNELDKKQRVYSIGSPTITVYNRKSQEASKGSTADIEIGKDMYIRQYYSQVKEIVIFEE